MHLHTRPRILAFIKLWTNRLPVSAQLTEKLILRELLQTDAWSVLVFWGLQVQASSLPVCFLKDPWKHLRTLCIGLIITINSK